LPPPKPSLLLQMIDGPPTGSVNTRWRAEAGTDLTIGRGQDAGVQLPDASVSRRHAVISYEGDEWVLRDQGSRHGTGLNTRVVLPGADAVLAHRDELQVGPWAFRVLISGSDAVSGMTMSMSDSTVGRLRRVLPTEMGTLVKRRLDLVLNTAEQLGRSEDESDIARIVVDTVIQGAGSARAALVRLREGEVELIASAGGQGGVLELSRSVIEEAARGEFVRLDMGSASESFGQSIIDLGIHSAFCAPVRVGDRIEAVLYLDARGDENGALQDAITFVGAMARMCGLALANLSRASLERHRAQLEADLAAARVAQRMMMPPSSGRVGPLRFAVTSKPGRFVAGDLIGVETRADGRVCCYLGDVTGKGAGAAMLMGIAQSYLSAALQRGGPLEDAVNGLNAMITGRVESGQFISLWIGEFDPERRVLRAIDAGHGYAMLRRGDGSVDLDLGEGGFPIGIDTSTPYTSGEIPISPGDCLLLFSDGLAEQPSPDGSRFGTDRVRELFSEQPDPELLLPILENEIFAFAATPHLDDDLSTAAFRLD
jgi:serine phosphatase RsbU (regulator of sigma subunit)/pSer/pThr/pTyr-binding forkhead associated (FHA) protein